jgi:NAD-dependent SIR2 family protein deacetylase
MSEKIRIGRCSICGGNVMAWQAWASVDPPPAPECAQCGAVAEDRGPVIPMKPRTTRYGEPVPPPSRYWWQSLPHSWRVRR